MLQLPLRKAVAVWYRKCHAMPRRLSCSLENTGVEDLYRNNYFYDSIKIGRDVLLDTNNFRCGTIWSVLLFAKMTAKIMKMRGTSLPELLALEFKHKTCWKYACQHYQLSLQSPVHQPVCSSLFFMQSLFTYYIYIPSFISIDPKLVNRPQLNAIKPFKFYWTVILLKLKDSFAIMK